MNLPLTDRERLMKEIESERIECEIECDRLLWEHCRELAQELVIDRGWKETDDDFLIQVEEEEKRQWDEETERLQSKEIFRRMRSPDKDFF